MAKEKQQNGGFLVEHFFRNEYGKIVAVISKFIGIDAAEDIVQETLLKAVEYWKHKGVPPNPDAWLYTTAKNKAINLLRDQKYQRAFSNQIHEDGLVELEFSDEQIADEQLRVMTACCQSSISEEVQITLILKILCGFSIAEIASAFCTKIDTIDKRLVRGREKLRKSGFTLQKQADISLNQETLITTIYLLFNEGYYPSKKNRVIRKDFCFEAIRLAEILVYNDGIPDKEQVHALLALMYLNCSRFEARMDSNGEMIEMELQDRNCWDQSLISNGLGHLEKAQKNQFISKYLVLGSISANHCIAQTYELTNWDEIFSLYDVLLSLEDSAIIRLNRLVAMSKVKGEEIAISELLKLKELITNYLYFATLAEFYKQSQNYVQAIEAYKNAIVMAANERDKQFLTKKLNIVVRISQSHV